MESKMLSCDFHIHTVFSECYQEPGVPPENNISQIINKCYDDKIDLIAFTDHNSISAYIEYKRIISELEQAVKYAEIYKIDKEQYADKLDLLEKYRSVNVLPGVEFDLRPGIHLITIFNPNISIRDITQLIESNGYCVEDGIGKGSPKYDVLDFLEILNKYDVITIAPHIENDKGIWENLCGDFRAAIFKSKNLNAVSCQNLKSSIYCHRFNCK